MKRTVTQQGIYLRKAICLDCDFGLEHEDYDVKDIWKHIKKTGHRIMVSVGHAYKYEMKEK